MTTTMVTFEVTGDEFDQAAADRLEAAAARPGATIEVTISGVRFTPHCGVGMFVLIDTLARPAGRSWRATVQS